MERPELSRYIQSRIEKYLSSKDNRFAWSFEAVRRFNFLPLYLGWTSVLGIRPDTSLVSWDHEDERETIHELTNPFLCRMALTAGAKEYPELRVLVPQRPEGAVTCDSCGGTGQLAGVPENVVCMCGGLGWLIPGEKREPGIA